MNIAPGQLVIEELASFKVFHSPHLTAQQIGYFFVSVMLCHIGGRKSILISDLD